MIQLGHYTQLGVIIIETKRFLIDWCLFFGKKRNKTGTPKGLMMIIIITGGVPLLLFLAEPSRVIQNSGGVDSFFLLKRNYLYMKMYKGYIEGGLLWGLSLFYRGLMVDSSIVISFPLQFKRDRIDSVAAAAATATVMNNIHLFFLPLSAGRPTVWNRKRKRLLLSHY